ncbi:MAG: winged helix-turn-helix domain-containing protein [Candidatus Bipolaricaulaceae bacterium]
MNRNEVYIAFEILLEEIEQVANGINEAGAKAFQKGAYDEARRMIEIATRLVEFREKVKALQNEWKNVFTSYAPKGNKRPQRRRERLKRGLRTPEDAFRKPILEALVELGGRAEMPRVLELLEKKMQGVLNDYDYQPLPSDPKTIRWRNTAQWCRNTMVREGLLKSDSPRGIWEISERGRQALQEDMV